MAPVKAVDSTTFPRSYARQCISIHERKEPGGFRYSFRAKAAIKKYLRGTKHPDKHSDFARVVRWITGQSVGLVLGGGGAKGAAHIGVLKYLNELDIPLDYIGGVSIGSFIGAIYAIYENFQVVEYKAKELWKELKNPFRYFRDLALPPLTPAFRGSGFNGFIMYSFGNIQMEDLYIPFFCVSTDLNASCARTHMSGDLWFYVRASMTISEVLPAQINQFDNHLLMDGGYSDLVPAMAMRKLGIKYLIAINIGDDRLVNTFNIGYHVSGLHCLFQNLLPYSTKGIPRRDDYWEAVLSCSARNFIQILKAMDEYCIYIRPAINGYNSMDFKSYEEIKTLGYNSTKFKFGSLKVQNLPVHVIWYLLRFYTYPAIAPSQSQLLAGFSDEDWAFAVNLMSKTQMFQRASNTFLEMNLTPYLTDLMEARSYLTNIINQKEITSINLHVPVLENFFRDDERLDLVHAIARMKEWTYMEDFETIVKETSVDKEVNLRAKTNLKIAASTTLDLKNARAKTHMTTEAEVNDDLVMWTARQSFSIKDLFKADPTLFRAGGSFMHLQMGKEKRNSNDNEDDEEGFERYSEAAFIHKKVHTDTNNTVSSSSALSLHSIAARFAKAKAANVKDTGKPAKLGQTLTDFRKRASKADGSKDSMPPRKLVPIMTLKQLRRSFESQGLTQL
ncbi:Patatin-like phospholipase domain-containing protein 7 [Orchesella cincta]|uniref:Patatin-like phospholipase domain-containing protein 7 n=1 Tax=Orchesella cincta TaxID=48709 RepID=A0A1D2MMR2_ORCCI|nr:Patatin-like phospholipase domain-containing protein 7 [Orchesella cincta]